MLRRLWITFVVLAASVTIVSSASAQLPVEDGLLLWLDATDENSIVTAGDCVDTWSDKSGNGFDAVLPLNAADACPTYSADAMNGMPAVRFHSETADGMEILDLSIDERPYTAFIVNQYWGDVRGRTLQGTGSNWLLGLWAGNFGHYASGWVSNPQPLAKVNFPYVADTVGTEFESTFHVNGLDKSDDTAPAGNPGGLGLVGFGQFPGELSDADISEVLFYDRALSEQELGSVRDYLHNKYGAVICEDVEACMGEPPVPEPLNVLAGTVGTFMTSGDLDFSGDFAYAINVGGPDLVDDFDPLVIGDAEFIAGTNADIDDVDSAGVGVSMTVANEIADWFSAARSEFGDGSIEDDNLAFAMQSIRWNEPPGLDVNMAVEEGQSYKLQMLFGEACCTRGFDITVEGELVVDNLLVSDVQDGTIDQIADGINLGDTGVAYTYEFTAGDGELNINLGGQLVNAPDNNPILHVLTLERIEGPIGPECDPNSGGDLDGNGTVEFADFLVLSGNFGNAVDSHLDGDIDCNGTVEFADFLVLSGNFGTQIGGTESVPEPAANLLVIVAAMLGLTVRRRR